MLAFRIAIEDTPKNGVRAGTAVQDLCDALPPYHHYASTGECAAPASLAVFRITRIHGDTMYLVANTSLASN